MTRLLTISFLFIFSHSFLVSQNCGTGGDNFFSPCNICGNGFFSNTAGFSPDNASYSFPCGAIENSQWASFTAASTTVSVQLTASSCANGDGVEMAMYDQNLNLVSNCFTAALPTSNGSITGTNLNIGQTYLIMVDGVNGDECSFILSLTGNQTLLPPVGPSPIISDANPSFEVCPGQEVCYSIDPVQYATDYEWFVPTNGTILFGQGTRNICVIYDAPGGGVVRCTPSNDCYPGVPAILPVVVLPVIPSILPPVFLCQSELPYTLNGIEYNNYGTQQQVLQNVQGCDSIVNFTLIPRIEIPFEINTNLCMGQCFMIGDSCYTDSTTIVIEGGGLTGCDSTIIFNPTYSLDSVTVNQFRDSIFCIDTCTQMMVDATVLGQNIITAWSTSNGTINATNGLFAEGCGAGDYVLSFTNSLTQNSCSVSINLSENEKSIGALDVLAQLSGETCVDQEFLFETTYLPNALAYNWSLPDGTRVSTTDHQLVVTKALNGNICVTATNDCGNSNEVCESVNIAPYLSPEFSIDSRICLDQTATITYLGNASATSGYNFYIPRGNIISGSGTGPYVVQFDNDGSYTIGLDVEGDGCQSPLFTQKIQVDTIIPPSKILCNRGADFVEFVWRDYGIVDDFSVNISSGQSGTRTGRTSYLVTDLGPNEPVTIEVVGNGYDNVCDPTAFSRETCNSTNLVIDPSNQKREFSNTEITISEVEIYPNPVTDNLMVNANSTINKIEVYDLNGKLIKLKLASNNIDISKIENGIYLVKITTEEGVSTERIQKI